MPVQWAARRVCLRRCCHTHVSQTAEDHNHFNSGYEFDSQLHFIPTCNSQTEVEG